MQIHELKKITSRKAKIVGRGIGSGKGGHTTGRGNKGQKARERVKIWFDGTKYKKGLIKRMPLLRGRGKFKPWGDKYTVISLDKLQDWPEKTKVTQESLAKAGLLQPGEKAKLTNGTKFSRTLEIEVPITKAAAKKLG